MAHSKRKIINDPVYGFITVDDPLLLQIIAHPYFQRLRRIYQMAFAHLVYPGAVHTRLHHALGAYHLMYNALDELQRKGISITPDEAIGAKLAILLHDVGHSPFSHALENNLVHGVKHEEISLLIMQRLNSEYAGALNTGIAIFKDEYPKRFLHQLVSGQLDVDRMDYLTRDSFFTGVSEGVIGYDRIIKMLCVEKGELVVEEKAIYSIEKFLVSRRLMYWQVYLHKTVLSAEKMLLRIIERARHLLHEGIAVKTATPIFEIFLHGIAANEIENKLESFCQLDDVDIMASVKNWMTHPDKVLSTLCTLLINRQLLKVRLQAEPIPQEVLERATEEACSELRISRDDAKYFVFTGSTGNTTYDPSDERINILFKNGELKDISKVDNALIHQSTSRPVKKFYICYLGTPG